MVTQGYSVVQGAGNRECSRQPATGNRPGRGPWSRELR